LFNLNSGSIKIDGQDIRACSLKSLRANISYVDQNTILFNDTVANNIAYEYNEMSEKIRLIMRNYEDLQFTNKIGIYKNTSNYEEKNDVQELKLFFSRVNDKHLSKSFKRII